MDNIARNLESIISQLPEGVSLVAVSKFHPAQTILDAYNAGQRIFGESRVQELLDKQATLPKDIKWHFIGHLQTNKLRKLIGKTALIESIDSERLLSLVDEESRRAGVLTRVLMQIHVAEEETKFGFLPEEIIQYFQSRKFENLTNTHICGVMGMASNTDNLERIRNDFAKIYSIYHDIRSRIAPDLRGFDIVSMGMSGDWKIAIQEGANLIRVGSAIFGLRNY